MVFIKSFIDLKRSNSFDNCIQFACNDFVKNFDHKIRELLHYFPSDYETSNIHKQKFWTEYKRLPNIINFDSTNEIHLGYICSYAKLLAEMLNIKIDQNINLKYVQGVSALYTIPKFEVKDKNISSKQEDEINAKKKEEETTILEKQILNLLKENEKLNFIDKSDITPLSLNLDNESEACISNYHCDFIYYATCLRAENFRISKVIKFILSCI